MVQVGVISEAAGREEQEQPIEGASEPLATRQKELLRAQSLSLQDRQRPSSERFPNADNYQDHVCED